MQITIENLELSVDSDVLFNEIRDEVTTLIEDAVHDAVQDAVMPAAEDAVAEYLRYNFDITDYFDGTNLDTICSKESICQSIACFHQSCNRTCGCQC